MRASKGIMLRPMILSSLYSFSDLVILPANLTRITASAKPVHHQDTNSVGWSSRADLARGGGEYMSRSIIIADAHQPPKRGEQLEGQPRRQVSC